MQGSHSSEKYIQEKAWKRVCRNANIVKAVGFRMNLSLFPNFQIVSKVIGLFIQTKKLLGKSRFCLDLAKEVSRMRARGLLVAGCGPLLLSIMKLQAPARSPPRPL